MLGCHHLLSSQLGTQKVNLALAVSDIPCTNCCFPGNENWACTFSQTYIQISLWTMRGKNIALLWETDQGRDEKMSLRQAIERSVSPFSALEYAAGAKEGYHKIRYRACENPKYSIDFTELEFGHKRLKSGTKRGSEGNYWHWSPRPTLSASDKPLRAFKYWSTNNQNK